MFALTWLINGKYFRAEFVVWCASFWTNKHLDSRIRMRSSFRENPDMFWIQADDIPCDRWISLDRRHAGHMASDVYLLSFQKYPGSTVYLRYTHTFKHTHALTHAHTQTHTHTHSNMRPTQNYPHAQKYPQKSARTHKHTHTHTHQTNKQTILTKQVVLSKLV